MKSTYLLFRMSILFFFITYCFAQMSFAQDSTKSIRSKIEGKDFVFKAQTATPAKGGIRQLTSDYDLKIKGDSLISYLPYYGRAYAGADLNEGGIQFTSTKFDYKMKAKSKGGWDITIKPKDTRDVNQMTLSISENGYSYLTVISNNRQTISFNGYIEK
jgi:hypothetical protein